MTYQSLGVGRKIVPEWRYDGGENACYAVHIPSTIS
jgi:hypothetical protein